MSTSPGAAALVEAVASFLHKAHGWTHMEWEQKPEQSREEWREEALALLNLPEFHPPAATGLLHQIRSIVNEYRSGAHWTAPGIERIAALLEEHA